MESPEGAGTGRPALAAVVTHGMLLAAALFWGTNPMMMKLGIQNLPPFAFSSLRLLIGIAVATPIAVLTGNWKRIERKDIVGLLFVPAMSFLVFQVFYTIGVSMTAASVASVVLAILPIAVAAISHISGAERLNSLRTIGVVTTLVGVAAIAFGAQGGVSVEGTQVIGVALLVLCEVAFGAYTVYLRPVSAKYPVPQITILIMISSLIPLGTFTLLRHGASIYSGMDGQGVLSALASGLLALVAANMLWTAGIKRVGCVNTSVYGNLQPVFGVAAGMIVLGERLGGLQIVGAAVVLTGILLVNRRQSIADDGCVGDAA